MSAPVEFVWRRKVGARGTQPVHGLAPTATVTAMCGTSTQRDTHWLEPLPGQPRCKVCVSTIVREYPTSVPGVAELAEALPVTPQAAARLVEAFGEHAERAVELIESAGYTLDDWQAEVVKRTFDSIANDSRRVG